jgi:hypothetical protein
MCSSTRVRQIVCGPVLVIFVASGIAQGQIWTGNGDGETWLVGSNWDAGVAPQVPGQTAIFDANFGVPVRPIQISGPIAISGIDVVNAPGNVRIADDEPLHPFLIFELDGGGAVVPIKLDATPGYSFSFEESINALQFNDDVEVDHQGTSADVFAIKSNVFGGRSLTLLPGTGRVELVGSSFSLNNLLTDMETQLGDVNPNGQLDTIGMTGDFRIGGAGNVTSRAFTQGSGSLDVNGGLRLEPRAFTIQNANLTGGGSIEILDLATIHIAGAAGGFAGKANLFGGTLSVGGPLGPGAQVVLHQFGTIGTTQPVYNPATDPAVVVDPSVITPGSVGLAIDNIPAYALPIDLNFNNGVDNAYRLGSPSLSRIAFGTPIVPFDDGVNPPVYYLGGAGHLFIDTTLTDSPLSGNSTDVIMPAFPQAEFGVNVGAIFLNQFTSFTGRVRVEQEQLVLSHPFAVAAAANLDIVAQGPQYDGGNYQHGTIVLDPALLGFYAGPAPNLLGGALGFAAPHTLAFLPTATGQVGPGVFDATNFDGGSPNSSLLSLGGGSPIMQDPAFAIDNFLSASGDPVILITTDQARVELTRPNLHTGGTAVVGRSTLVISDSNQLGPGPLNIASGATLRIVATTSFANTIDLHDTFAFGNSGIEVLAGVSADFKGNFSTAAAPQGTFTKRGPGRLVFDPSVPWSPVAGENLWGLRHEEGDVVLAQLPEYEPGPVNWQTGPLVLRGSPFVPASLVVTNATVANATNPDNAGFRVLNVEGGSLTQVIVEPGADLKLAGVNARNEVFGGINKLGQGTLWFGGDSSGRDAVGSHYTGRGDLDIREGTVIVGGLAGTDDLARAFPDDVVLRIQDGAKLVKMQDQPGRVQSLYIGDASPVFGIADLTLLPSGTGLGDGSLNANIGPLGALHIRGVLIKDGPAPLRLSAQPGAAITVTGGLNIIDGAVEVDASGIDPLTDTISGISMGVNTNGPGTLHVTAGTARVNGLGGTGRTRVEAGARLDVAGAAGQRVYQINGEIVSSSFIFVNELLTGRGQVTGDAIIANGAALAPNDDSAFPTPAPATFTITDDLTMSIGSELNIDVDGTTASADLVDIGGTADVGGALTIDVHSPFNSLGTSSHLILSAGGGIINPFVVTPNPGDYLGSGVEFAGIMYAAGGNVIVDLQQTAYADFDDDEDVDATDLAIWQTGYGITGIGIHSSGDADLDGDVDGRDFLIWQRQAGTTFATLPSITPGNVPEPGTWFLALVALSVGLRRHSFPV